MSPCTSTIVSDCRRAAVKTAAWLPTGNRVNCRARPGDNNPSRRSACTDSPRRSSRASRRHTQLLCRPSSVAASTCDSPSSRTSACTIHASSSSLGRRPTLLRAKIAALAERSSTSSRRTLKRPPANLGRRGPPLEAVQQFGPSFPPTGGDRG